MFLPSLNVGENEMREVFLEAEAPSPKSVKFFQSKSKSKDQIKLL